VSTNYTKKFKYANERNLVEWTSRFSMQTYGETDVTKTVVDRRLARQPTLVLHTGL